MKIIYSDVFIYGIDLSMTEILCKSASNGITFTVSGNSVLLPPCAINKSEMIGDLTITEIAREDDFINLYGYSDAEPLVAVRAHCLIINHNNCGWSEIALETGIGLCSRTNLPNTDENGMTNIPGIFSVNSSYRDWSALSSAINSYLIEEDRNHLCRA